MAVKMPDQGINKSKKNMFLKFITKINQLFHLLSYIVFSYATSNFPNLKLKHFTSQDLTIQYTIVDKFREMSFCTCTICLTKKKKHQKKNFRERNEKTKTTQDIDS